MSLTVEAGKYRTKVLAGPVSADKGSFPAVQTDVFLLFLRQRAENGVPLLPSLFLPFLPISLKVLDLEEPGGQGCGIMSAGIPTRMLVSPCAALSHPPQLGCSTSEHLMERFQGREQHADGMHGPQKRWPFARSPCSQGPGASGFSVGRLRQVNFPFLDRAILHVEQLTLT